MAEMAPFNDPPWIAAARRYLGTAEIPGPASNPVITSFFRSVTGKLYAEDTAWCAAFVGACLAEAGLQGTGSLLARSYLDYGTPIEKPRYGCIVVLSRGGASAASSWKGHVGFCLGERGDRITVLGGNQNNAVTVAQYPSSRVIGLRWPTTTPPSPDRRADIRHLQHRLIELGYHETGKVDGVMGIRTRAALLAFKADNGLPLDAAITAETSASLARPGIRRPIAPERSQGRPSSSRIIGNSSASIASSVAVGAGSLIAGAEPMLSTAEQAAGLAGRIVAAIHAFAGLITHYWPWMVLGGTAATIYFSGRAIAARLADHRSGRTP